jgi:hypothetical protein
MNSDVREAAGRLHMVYAGESYTDVYRDKLRADGMEGSLAVPGVREWLERHGMRSEELHHASR